MSKQQVQALKIRVPSKFVNDLATKLGTSKITVYQSLAYNNNSDLAEAIRASAKKLLEAEAKKIK
jgi:hypothetical protein